MALSYQKTEYCVISGFREELFWLDTYPNFGISFSRNSPGFFKKRVAGMKRQIRLWLGQFGIFCSGEAAEANTTVVGRVSGSALPFRSPARILETCSQHHKAKKAHGSNYFPQTALSLAYLGVSHTAQGIYKKNRFEEHEADPGEDGERASKMHL